MENKPAAPTTEMQPTGTATEPSALEARTKPKKKPPNARQKSHSVGGWKKGAPEWEGFGEHKKGQSTETRQLRGNKELSKSNIILNLWDKLKKNVYLCAEKSNKSNKTA